jgi:hypothetical protein
MQRPVLAVVAAVSLAACGGSDDSEALTSSSQDCTVDVCGTPGAPLTVRLSSFDHDTDELTGFVGSNEVSLVVTEKTQPMPAEPCSRGGPVAGLITAWNATQPMNPYAPVDIYHHDNPYRRLLTALARFGVDADITLASDATTVATLKPMCPASP